MKLFLKAAGGNYSSPSTWSSVSKDGTDDAGVPTDHDDVVLEAGAGNLVINVNSVCLSFVEETGYTGTVSGTGNLSIGDQYNTTAGENNKAFQLQSGSVFTATGTLYFISISPTIQTIDFAGKNTGNVNFNAQSNGSWKYVGSHIMGAAQAREVRLVKGTLDINGQTCEWGSFSAYGTEVRSLKLGAANITIKNYSTTINGWNFQLSTNLTFDPGTSTITFTNYGAGIAPGGRTFNNIVVSGGSISFTFDSHLSCANFTYNGTGSQNNSLEMGGNLTCSGTFTANGNSVINRAYIKSNIQGTKRTITAANVVVTNADFEDIKGAGAGSWDLSAVTGGSGDCGGNSDITFTTPTTQIATMSTNKNWSDASIWTSRSPLPQDNVSLSGVTGGTLTCDKYRLGKDIDWTGATGSPVWNVSGRVFGSITLIAGMSFTGSGGVALAGRSSHTITSAGRTFSQSVELNTATGTYTLQDDFACTGTFNHTRGTFVDNGNDVTVSTYSSSNSNVRALTKTGTWYLTATSALALWNIGNSTNMTLSDTAGEIVVVNASANAREFVSANKVYKALSYIVTGSSGSLTIKGTNTIETINFHDEGGTKTERTLRLEGGKITNVTNFNFYGSTGVIMSLTSTNGSQATLSANSTNKVLSFANIANILFGGTTRWFRDSTSTDGGNNTNLIFMQNAKVYIDSLTAWKEMQMMQIKLGGTWKTVSKAQVKIDGEWKQIF